ncbi:PIG-L deacetylase family protein [Paractinoplanes rishiriensis]|uniref:1D-myo-inositol 2-acetamido-2-deoxy-alpha-D-glucopyranoside deacetylase n=1 Tax=Paractinoplanes rishiriensis TaxID=1050105 RepID=A0A919MXE7_9ACTN|nr:PIG-L family deacetylase [Actinoplanes rishiriensis]GIE95630.1 1D-myo-inositol 2-acetamido-2-deoxy-alpha-D-glucopyranoside deacetylase [Actinoplanes rishiriensis]
MRLGTVLGIWAHPDDEVYLSGGLMATARAAGDRVVCVTATLGEHGTGDPQRWPPDRLARTRAVELRASLAALGVDEHRLLGLPDGDCPGQPFEEVSDRIAAIVDEVRPDTILTFGPDGFTGHADHRTVSAWATTAHAKSKSRARLLYATSTDEFAEQWQHVYDRLPVFIDGAEPLRTPVDKLAVHLKLDEETADRKLAALRCQATQTAGVVALLGEDTMRDWCATEAFVLGA